MRNVYKALITSLLLCSPFSYSFANDFREGFENWDDNDLSWLPAGWSRISDDDSLSPESHWRPFKPTNDWGLDAPEGERYFQIHYDAFYKDEWLVTPLVEIPPAGELSFIAYINGLYMFNMDDEHFSWDLQDFVLREPSAVLQIWLMPEGEEAVLLKDYYEDEFKDKTFLQLLLDQRDGFMQRTFNLAEYAGKYAKIGFRYVGTDGDNISIDDVAIYTAGVPASFSGPLSTLYYGTAKDCGILPSPRSIEYYPAYTPLDWTMENCSPAALYEWAWEEGADSELQTCHDLTLTRELIPEGPGLEAHFFTPHYLKGSQEGLAEGYAFCTGEYLQGSGETGEYGLLPFDIASDGLINLQMPPIKQNLVPVTGKNDDTDEWWSIYWLGQSPTSTDNVKMNSIMNIIAAPESTLVIDGCWVNAIGKVDDDATFTAKVFPLEEDGSINFHSTPLAFGECQGKDIIHYEAKEGSDYDTLTLPFTFSSPAILDMADNSFFIVEISGFNSDKVEYFSPYQSWRPNKAGMTHGWMRVEVTEEGSSYDDVAPLSYFSTEKGSCLNAFAINLKAECPYLLTPKDAMIPHRHEEYAIPVKCSWGADKMAISIEGGCGEITARMEGQYQEAAIVVENGCYCEETHEYILRLDGPGVSSRISLKEDPSSVDMMECLDGMPVEIFNLQGIRVNDTSALPSGIYLFRYPDGRTRKKILR